jgi:hypothetical protein
MAEGSVTVAKVHTLCFGCRAYTRVPPSLSDDMAYITNPPPGFRAERFNCERCGVEDVRVVLTEEGT